MPANKKFSFAFIQMMAQGDSVEKNVNHALDLIRQAVKEYNPKIVALPECFNSPYAVADFHTYAEYVPSGYTCQALSNIAKELNIYLFGGTIPERDPQNKGIVYNTATVWGPDGKMLAKYRKVHLYDVNITDESVPISFKESSTITPGNSITTLDIEGVKFGVLICFDIYFDEYVKLYRKEGCDMIMIPIAFNPVSGPLHWDLLVRGRANDNQCYVAGISGARDDNGKYVSWGYTAIADPFGKMLQEIDDKERIMYQEIDFSKVQRLRAQIPTFQARRTDIYDVIKVQK